MNEEQRAALMDLVVAGLATLERAAQEARDDIPAATDRAAQATALRGQVAAWSPTGTLADLRSIRDVLVTVLAALIDLYGYRAANDRDAALSHDSVAILARYLFDPDEEENNG